ncbi:MAG: pyridoxal-phosphate dependent enzyme [Nitrososphaeria archaeon]
MYYNMIKPYFESRGNGITVRVGNTPVLRLEIDGVEFYAKAEWFNYFELSNGFKHGSVKMRAAYYMVKSHIDKGLKSKTVVEPTSGNTGIALAALAKLYGFKFLPIVSFKVTQEVKEILSGIGFPALEVDDNMCPRVSNTDTDQAIALARSYALSPATKDRYLWLNQYENEDNPRAHEETTAKEIALFGNIDAVVTGIGTGGSYVGLKKGLENAGIAVTGVQPQKNHRIQGLRNLSESALLPKILEKEATASFPVVKDDDAFTMIEKVFSKYDMLLGPSSGVTAWYAYQLAKKGKRVMAVFADTGQNYASVYREMKIADSKYDFIKLYDVNNLPIA